MPTRQYALPKNKGKISVPSTQRITLYAVILEGTDSRRLSGPDRISSQKVRFFKITIRALLPSFCFAKIHLPPGGRLGGGADADGAWCVAEKQRQNLRSVGAGAARFGRTEEKKPSRQYHDGFDHPYKYRLSSVLFQPAKERFHGFIGISALFLMEQVVACVRKEADGDVRHSALFQTLADRANALSAVSDGVVLTRKEKNGHIRGMNIYLHG
jgi:hypothetical protein